MAIASANPATGEKIRAFTPLTAAEIEKALQRATEAFRNYRRTSGVIIDRCHDHGTWLDADELERIAGFIKSGGLERAKAAAETTMKAPAPPRPETGATLLPRSFLEHRPVGHRYTLIVDSLSDLLSRLLNRLH